MGRRQGGCLAPCRYFTYCSSGGETNLRLPFTMLDVIISNDAINFPCMESDYLVGGAS